MLNKEDIESSHTVRKPSLTGRGNIGIDDIELLANTKKMSNSYETASDAEIDNLSLNDDNDEFESDSDDEISGTHKGADSHTDKFR